MKKNRRNRSGSRSGSPLPPSQPSTAQPKTLTVGMGGFDGLIQALGRIPLEVNRALPLIERGEYARVGDMLTASLVKVELAKASILGNLALVAMREGDIGKATGYVDIAIESLTELGLEGTELGKMLAIVHANLPGDTPAEGASAAGNGDAAAQILTVPEPPPEAVDGTSDGKREGE